MHKKAGAIVLDLCCALLLAGFLYVFVKTKNAQTRMGNTYTQKAMRQRTFKASTFAIRF